MSDPKNWWRGSVTYQIYPRSFMDSSGNGVGDLPGIINRLDHIASLGVDAIWLSPIFTSPMKDMGYDVSDYVSIDPMFGSLSDFDHLIERAHELGLKVIIDQVISHSSDQHPFFQESRLSHDNNKADWYVWADPRPDGTPPNNWLSIFGGSAWQWDTRRNQYYLHNFLREQPDFNMHNPEVQDYLLGTMRFWLERGVDGFRLDTVNFYFHDDELRDNPVYTPDEILIANPYYRQNPIMSKNRPENVPFLEKMRALLDEFDARTMVGEVGEHVQPLELMAEYTKGDARLHMAYSFDMLGYQFTPEFFRSQIEQFFEIAPDGWPCWAFSNHDVIRHVTRHMPHAETQDSIAKLCAGLLLSLQGSVCLYQGEELGLTETDLVFEELTDPQGIEFWPADKGRDGCRTPMVWEKDSTNAGFSDAAQTWLPVKQPQRERAADTQHGENSVLNFYRTMLNLRKITPSLRDGTSEFLDTPDPVLAFTRGGDTLCVFNLSADDAEVTFGGISNVLLSLNSEASGETIKLGPNGLMIAAL